MIYECPNCHVPQAAGHTACHQCGAEFDSPVPEDALVPAETIAPESGLHEEALPETVSLANESTHETRFPEPPVLEEVFAPAPQFQPSEMPPYQAPPSYQPAPGYLPPAYTAPPAPVSRFSLPKALLIAIPIVLLFVLGAVFFANSLNQSADTAPAPPALTVPDTTIPVVAPPVPHGSPLVLSGGSGTASNTTETNPNIAWLVGRWQNKATDYYVFDDNGNGNRGSSGGKLAKGSFLWVLNQKQLVLYTDATTAEKLAFSQGSDDATMYLRGSDDRYVQYTRAKTSP